MNVNGILRVEFSSKASEKELLDLFDDLILRIGSIKLVDLRGRKQKLELHDLEVEYLKKDTSDNEE